MKVLSVHTTTSNMITEVTPTVSNGPTSVSGPVPLSAIEIVDFKDVVDYFAGGRGVVSSRFHQLSKNRDR